MLINSHPHHDWVFFCLLLMISSAMEVPTNAVAVRKLDDTTVPGDPSQKCTPCNKYPPPSPPPPPPALPPPKKPPTVYCPPPPAPPSSFIYITGPPGNLYPIDQDFSNAGRSAISGLPVLIGCGFGSLLIAFW